MLQLPGCLGIAEDERVRTYDADIARDAVTGYQIVTLSGREFFPTGPSRFHVVPMTADQFVASDNDGVASFHLWADWESSFGGHIRERMKSGNWIDIEGEMSGPITASAVEAVGRGTASFCAVASAPDGSCPGARWLHCDSPMSLSLVAR